LSAEPVSLLSANFSPLLIFETVFQFFKIHFESFALEVNPTHELLNSLLRKKQHGGRMSF
jgi:hypothetical protein